MAQTVVIDAVEVAFRVPTLLPDRDAVAAYRTVQSDRFMRRLRGAVRAVVVQFPELARVTFTLSR
jgi:hypothetical protein